MTETDLEVGGERSMAIDSEELQKGWKLLGEYLGLSESKLKRMRPELMGCGAVFLVRRGRGNGVPCFNWLLRKNDWR